MIGRCHNPNSSGYSSYGGRGITVCERWRDFANFLADMGERPEGKTLDRIDGSLGYFPENCRWATVGEQNRNTRRNHNVTYNGETHCVSEWARRAGISHETLRGRLAKGWSMDRALTPYIHPEGTRNERRNQRRAARRLTESGARQVAPS